MLLRGFIVFLVALIQLALCAEDYYKVRCPLSPSLSSSAPLSLPCYNLGTNS